MKHIQNKTKMIKHLHSVTKKVVNLKAGNCATMAVFLIWLLVPSRSFAQVAGPGTGATADAAAVKQDKRKLPEPTYPKVVGYLSFIIPTGTLQNNKITYNFASNTKIGFPVGVNVLYSDKFGFSYEFTPTIKTKTLSGSSSMSNLLFDPGPMFRFKHGFTIISRLAFETSGRYGVTPVFNEVYLRTKAVNYFVAMSLPVRWGADSGVMQTGSVGLNVQFGFTFN